MKLIILHTDDGETVGLNADHIVSFNAASSKNFPQTKAVIHFVDSEGGMRVRESFEHVCRIIQGTATAKQEAAERTDLDERLASIERHLERIDSLNDSRAVTINDLYDKVERLEQQAEDRDRKVGLWWDTMADALNRKEARIVALEERQSDIMESLHLQRQRIKRLEDELAGLTQQTSQEQHTNDRHYEEQGDRIKQLEDGLRGLRRHVMGQEGRDYGERP